MAAKKNTHQTTADKTNKRRQSKTVQTATAPAEAPAQAERAPAEPVEATATPIPERSIAATPMPAEGETTPPDQLPQEPIPPNQADKVTKLSALDAATKVLGETGQPMSCPELITAMAAKGYWRSPKGRTPASTLYSTLLRELQTKGDRARFVKVERGKLIKRLQQWVSDTGDKFNIPAD